MPGKYKSLYQYLENRYANTVVLTFAQIEDLLGFSCLTRLASIKSGAVQTVLEVLERRRAAAHKTVHPDKLSAATKPR